MLSQWYKNDIHTTYEYLVNSKSIECFKPSFIRGKTYVRSIVMHSSSRKIVINEGFVGDDPTTEKPVRIKQINDSSKEDIAHVGAVNDSGSPIYETLEEKPRAAKGSNARYFGLVILACLLSIVALLLTLLLIWGKIGEKCECLKNEGKKSWNVFVN